MKKIVFLFVAMLMAFTVAAQGKFSFAKGLEHDFGTINEGVKAEHVFKFENTGNAPIVITDVRASCGCTTPEWPKEPIMPGESASIKAVFDSNGRPGNFYKTITITSNAVEPSTKLVIKGAVTAKTQQPGSQPNK